MSSPEDASTDALKRRARVAVMAMTLAFGLQVVYVARVEEPYPAIMMPRFSWAGPTQASSVDIAVPDILMDYADGARKTFTQAELFPRVPGGHAPTVMKNLLSPVGTDLATSRWQPPRWLFPGYHLAAIARDRPENVASLKAWLQQRAAALYPNAPPLRCTVNWYDDRFAYDPRTNPTDSRTARELTGTFELDLR
jgi:hypothetical protein